MGHGELTAVVSFLSNIQRHPIEAPEVEQFIREKNLSALHSGDQECLFVCLEQRIPIVLTDDMALRTASKRFNPKLSGFTFPDEIGIQGSKVITA